ncbi:MAG: tetratricopeptide repeat protein, partial [Pirellulales bacterium]
MTAESTNSKPKGSFCGRTRREFLRQTGAGFTSVTLTGMLASDGFFASRATAAAQLGGAARGSKITLKDGRVIEGRLAKLKSLAEKPMAAPAEGAPDPRLIVLIDDNLRRVFVPLRRILEADESATGQAYETFHVRQTVADQGGRVAMVGPIVHITEFSEFGRRILEMNTNQGPISVVQGITLITPKYIKVEALDVRAGKDFIWDMRIAFTSLPRETLGNILARQIDPKNIEHRLKLVRLYLQAERYKDAELELDQVLNDFPERKEQFARTLLDLKQAFARRALAEIRLRSQAGQHRLAQRMLKQFPTDKVASETLQAVSELQNDYRARFEQGDEVLKKIDEHLALIRDSALRDRLKPIRDEIHNELYLDSLPRMAAYRQFWDDSTLEVEDKLALAVSGWLVGANDATRRLPVALSLYEVRGLVRQYLAEPVKLQRNRILAEFASQEGATPAQVAKILAHMKPPLETAALENLPGFFELAVDGLAGEPPVTYYVQLPPEYDPHRRYPTILTLHGAGTTPQQQIDWWAGSSEDGAARLGQATRQGYIVVAPLWSQEHQTEYRYSAAEHAAVLNVLRDACRRFSVDTDKVFLSGHSMGGDAAWDIGLAHPDLWAGVIPIVAQARKYCAQYWQNAKLVPFYVLQGELDGDKVKDNARDLNRYMVHRYDITVIEYQGRGHE